MKCDINARQRQPLRLKNWNYSSPACYFVTICVKNKECFLGHVEEDKMALNEYGKIVITQWEWLARQYLYVKLDAFVVMPNHLHGIVKIGKMNVVTGRDLSLPKIKSLSELIGAFKTTSSKLIHQDGFVNFFWQRSFHDRIIRSPMELRQIRQYIFDNPSIWQHDEENPKFLNGAKNRNY